jgi:hypothetical protein
MTIGYRSFARSNSKDARTRRAISQLVAGGADTSITIEPLGGGDVEINGTVKVNGTILGSNISVSSSTDSAAANSSIYWSTTQNALCYKHSNAAVYLFTLVLAH